MILMVSSVEILPKRLSALVEGQIPCGLTVEYLEELWRIYYEEGDYALKDIFYLFISLLFIDVR